MFATVTATDRLLSIEVQQPCCTDAEFAAFADHVADVYEGMPCGFVLHMDMMRMQRLPLAQAMKWMTMFHRVLPVTRERLVCTCVCFDDPLVRVSADLFLQFYHPVKPLHMFDTRAECRRRVEQEL